MLKGSSRRLPAVAPASNPKPLSGYYVAVQTPRDGSSQQEPAPLSHFAAVLRRHAWKILAFVAVSMIATYAGFSRIRPMYESTVKIDVDWQAPSEIIGQNSTRADVGTDAEQFLMTQIDLIQSDAVLRPVATRFNLLEREDQFAGKTEEEIREIRRDAIHLKRLSVVRPPKTYLLQISYRSTDPEIAAQVANAVAESYVAHTYAIRVRSSEDLSQFMESQLGELRAKMERSGLALARFEKELSLVNPEEKTNILSARLLQLNTEYTNAQADRAAREAAYNSMKSGTLEAAQVSSQGQSLALITERLNQAQEHFAEVKTTFGTVHPEYQKAAAQIRELQKQLDTARRNTAGRIEIDYRQAVNREQILRKEVEQTKAEADRLNARFFEYQQLKREAEADKTLHDELVRKIREANINADSATTTFALPIWRIRLTNPSFRSCRSSWWSHSSLPRSSPPERRWRLILSIRRSVIRNKSHTISVRTSLAFFPR